LFELTLNATFYNHIAQFLEDKPFDSKCTASMMIGYMSHSTQSVLHARIVISSKPCHFVVACSHAK